MEPKYQYRIVVNGVSSKVLDEYPDNWSRITELTEERGGHCVLWRRSLHGMDIRPLLTSELGWQFYPAQDLAVSDWEILAEVDATRDNVAQRESDEQRGQK